VREQQAQLRIRQRIAQHRAVGRGRTCNLLRSMAQSREFAGIGRRCGGGERGGDMMAARRRAIIDARLGMRGFGARAGARREFTRGTALHIGPMTEHGPRLRVGRRSGRPGKGFGTGLRMLA